MAKIVSTNASYNAIDVELQTSDNRTFYMRILPSGIECYSDYQSVWGTTAENPVTLTPDEIFAAIANKGSKKPFKARVGVQPKR